MGISVGIVGLGQFGREFVELFRSHPLVARIALCDREAERIQAIAARPGGERKFSPRDAYGGLDELLKSDVDAVAVFTQPWLHAPQCVQAMEAGKHAYSAVPILRVPDGDEILDWCGRIVETTLRTGCHYMLGETTYYHPESMFWPPQGGAKGRLAILSMRKASISTMSIVDAAFARFTKRGWIVRPGGNGLMQASHTIVRASSSGRCTIPPHSTCGPVTVMKAHAVKVTAYGYRNQNGDPFFEDFAFSNETALFKMSNEATVRISECREIAGGFQAPETFRIMGTRGTYNERKWKENFRTGPLTAKPLETTALTDEEMRDPLPPEVALAFARIKDPNATDGSGFVGDGHGGSHPYLVHEFVDAVAHDRLPAIHAWEAARYMVMGGHGA